MAVAFSGQPGDPVSEVGEVNDGVMRNVPTTNHHQKDGQNDDFLLHTPRYRRLDVKLIVEGGHGTSDESA